MRKYFAKILGLALTMTILAGAMCFTASATDPYFSGSGTETDPFLISTPQDLVQLGELTNAAADDTEYEDKYYKLTKDIDMSGVTGFYGIARRDTVEDDTSTEDVVEVKNLYANCSFSGTIDGDGHIISNMTIDRSNNVNKNNRVAGLICWSGGATVKKLGLVGASITTGDYAAGFSGNGSVIINDCFVRTITLSTTSTTSTTYKRALATGMGNNSQILNCYCTTSNVAPAQTSTDATGVTAHNMYANNGIGTGSYASYSNLMNIQDYTEEAGTTFITASNGAFEADTYSQNGGYPVLAWENDFFSGGAGTEDDPYLISTPQDLVELAELTNATADDSLFEDKYYKLTNDIDMSGVSDFKGIARKQLMNATGTNEWTSTYADFSGTIDGDEHVIKNITVDSTARLGSNQHAALILWASGATIKNLGIKGATMNSTNNCYASGFVARGSATIENCFIKSFSSTIDPTYQAAFIGYATGASSLKNCYATGNALRSIKAFATDVAALSSYENVYTNNATFDSSASQTNTYNYGGSVNATLTGTDQMPTFISSSNGAFVADIFCLNNTSGTLAVLAWENNNRFGMKIDADKITIYNGMDDISKGAIVIAAYKAVNGAEQMLSLVYLDKSKELAQGAATEVSYNAVAGAEYYRAFAWNSLEGLVPLCEAPTYPEA